MRNQNVLTLDWRGILVAAGGADLLHQQNASDRLRRIAASLGEREGWLRRFLEGLADQADTHPELTVAEVLPRPPLAG